MSKLALGLYLNAPELVADVMDCAADSVLLVEDALHLAGAIRANLPHIEINGRKWLDAGDQIGRITSPNRQQIARDWINQAMDQYPDVDNWQLYNEVVAIGDSYLLEQQVEAEIAGASACADRGKGAIVVNQPPGNYPTLEPSDTQRWWWDAWLIAVRPIFTARGVRYFGVHCYSSEKARLAEPSCLWYSLRYRLLLRDLAVSGVQYPPLCITEYGHAGGWRGWLSENDCKADLTWYGTQLEMDASERVRSAHLFADGDSGGWGDYDVRGTGIPVAMGAWNRSIPGGTTMAWDRNEVWDKVCQAAGAPGYNEANAISQFTEAHPEMDIGINTSDVLGYDRADWPYLVQPTTNGALLYQKTSHVITFAKTRAQLPLS